MLLLLCIPAGCEQRAESLSSTTPPINLSATTTAPVVDRRIRVQLLRETSQCAILIQEPFDVRDAAGSCLASLDHPVPLTCTFDTSGIQLGSPEQTFPVDSLELVPSGSGLVEVQLPDGPRRYRGSLRLVRRGDNAGAVINAVDIEDYLIGVVAAEVPSSFAPAALAAQAIAARTYAWYQKLTVGRSRDWDVTDSESYQVYIGVQSDARAAPAARAVRETRGLVCTWDSPEGPRVFPTYYSSTCGGCTRVARVRSNEPAFSPLCGGVLCDYCRHSPVYRWEPLRLDKSVVTAKLRRQYPLFSSIGQIEAIEVVESVQGRPVRLKLLDGRGRSIDLDAEDFRLSLDSSGRLLKSTYCVPVSQGATFVFTEGRGFGHGVGMCQYGADGMARAGKTPGEILRHYYPSTELIRAY
jgi:stage II sporulation protein D